MQLQEWLKFNYVILHGNDYGDRLEIIRRWKSTHVNPDWDFFSLTECRENCSWSEVLDALQTAAPIMMERTVIVPKADNLFAKDAKMPEEIKKILQVPIENTKLLLVLSNSLDNSQGIALNNNIFNTWQQEGRIFKTDNLDIRNNANITAWIEKCASKINLKLDIGVANMLAKQIGNNTGMLRRALEILDLICIDHFADISKVESAIFYLDENDIFAWTKAWKSGSIHISLKILQKALFEYSINERYLIFLSQARREIEYLCNIVEMQQLGIKEKNALMKASGLSIRQEFLLQTYIRVANRIGLIGAHHLLKLINQIEQDIKGCAVIRSTTPLMYLTIVLCRAWSI